jgi:hypothetical protein
MTKLFGTGTARERKNYFSFPEAIKAKSFTDLTEKFKKNQGPRRCNNKITLGQSFCPKAGSFCLVYSRYLL